MVVNHDAARVADRCPSGDYVEPDTGSLALGRKQRL
jgi:hypothetical protein